MSIPASQIVKVIPGVVKSGGNPIVMNGLFLTQNTQMPTGAVLSFPSVASVSSFFGPASQEAGLAAIYFAGFVNGTLTPGAMLFAAFNLAARAAFLQSGSLASLSLNALKALTGILTITVDGVVKTSSTITLTSATSFSNAATIIAAAFTSGPAVAWNPVTSSFSFTSTTTGVTSTITFATGSLSSGLALTSATGAFISQGAVLDTPTSAMTNAVAISQNWATLVTLFEPSLSDKQLFAAWFSAQNNQYGWPAWDTDAQSIVQGSTTCFGAIAKALAYDGVMPISGDPAAVPAGQTLAGMLLNVATFVAGFVASINFGQRNGRQNMAFRAQAGLLPTCASLTTATILLANGYSYYGQSASANNGFIFFYNGQMPGQFRWFDAFVNQIYMNNGLQTALMVLEMTVGTIPYDEAGYSLMRSAMRDPIDSAINFGGIRTGVALSDAQVSQINQAAGGVDAATDITNNGYYLQILDPGAQARGLRTTPIVNFWYADGGSVQVITLSSIDVQ